VAARGLDNGDSRRNPLSATPSPLHARDTASTKHVHPHSIVLALSDAAAPAGPRRFFSALKHSVSLVKIEFRLRSKPPHLCQTDDLSLLLKERGRRFFTKNPSYAAVRGEKGEARMDQPVSLRQGAFGRRVASVVFGLLSLGSLGGCVETTALSGNEIPEARAKLSANERGIGPGGVQVVLASLAGVPRAFENRMKDAFWPIRERPPILSGAT
jgi:hypothetical protein